MDPSNKPISQPYETLLQYANGDAAFRGCLVKLENEGVNLHKVSAWRKDLKFGEPGPVIYTITVKGQNREEKPAVLVIGYDQSVHSYTCGEPEHDLYRCW
jgi:hypothetical protein